MHVVPGRYRHFKGGHYNVIGVASGTEDGSKVVVYQPLYGSHCYEICWRALTVFIEHVDRGTYKGQRFVLVEEYDEPRIEPQRIYQD
jgi:hypothetical protein